MPMWGSSVPVSLHCDSQADIGIAKNYAYNGKTRHILIRHGAVKELLKNEIISLGYVRSKRNLTDLLTKGLTRRVILETRRVILETSRAMGLNPYTNVIWEGYLTSTSKRQLDQHKQELEELLEKRRSC
ncbi:UNVERIFIED_CONTAM: hypothetical protein Slati_1726100 [Sesamum latifolium]|uniref:Uncharacterized protein n=1 Tax=Sesamum latifolium TaxID=2727402 RepID=A0AAW2X000_9LAMI